MGICSVRGGRRGCHGERGNALVLSTLILLALTSVGMLSVQQANTDLMVSGNVARATFAKTAAESGLTHAMELIGPHLQYYTEQTIRERLEDNETDKRTELAAYSTADPDPSNYNADSTEHIPCYDPGCANAAAALRTQGLAYRVESQYLYDYKGKVGNDLGRDICHFVFDLNAKAGIPSMDRMPIADTLDTSKSETVIIDFRARAVTGPAQCSKSTNR